MCAKTPAEQYDRVKQVLTRLENSNVKLNIAKCVLNQSSVEFLGYVVSDKGISPSPTKVSAIENAPVPKNLNELQSFIGFVTYYSRFIHRFSDIMSPLYDLTQKNIKFVWTKRQQVAYDLIKKAICSSEILTCFSGKSKIIIETDASPVGVGCVLLQVENGIERPIAFSSKRLTKAEVNYSQTDREALALVFAVNKFKYYILGRNFELRTDHKPLLGLFGRNKCIPTNANSRLIRWSILLAQYDYDLYYKSGRTNHVADALSRLPIDDDTVTETPSEYISMIDSLDNFKFSFETIKELTKKDKV